MSGPGGVLVAGGSPGVDSPLTATYDNNNEANASKMKQQQQQQQHHKQQQRSTDSVDSNRGHKIRRRHSVANSASPCPRAHLNSLWSVWYGFFGTFLQAYTAVKCTKRFLRYSVLPWTSATAVWELHVCLLVTGLAVLILPLFLAAAVFKVGNHANDGYKLGRGGTSASQPLSTGACSSLWRHGGPTAAFLHLVIAFSFLVPKLVMEARLVEAGFLPTDALWRTDLDFMVVHHDRLVVLSFMTAASPGSNVTTASTPGTTTSTTTPSTVDAGSMGAAAATLLNTSAHQQPAGTAAPSTIAHGLFHVLKQFFNMEDDSLNIGGVDGIDSGFGSSVSVEYLNYALALLVYSVRYPAVFWNTNKCFGIIFSIQLLANSVQSLLAFAGMSVLYKVQVVGAWKALPLLRHYPDGVSPLGGRSPFLLNAHVTLALSALCGLLVLSSSLVLYLYGHGRYHAFLRQHRDKQQRHVYSGGGTDNSASWGYLTHCAALCALLATAVTHAPLLHDYTVVYRGSLDGAVLACIGAAIGHLFLWVLVWLFLTIKHKWTFKIRITVGRATVRSARSVHLVTDVELAGRRSTESGGSSSQPLLVVGNGRAYAVTEAAPRKAIMSVVQKAAVDRREQSAKASSSSTSGGSETADDETEEQIYWLRPALVTPQRSPDSASEERLCWFSSRKRSSGHSKHKVTFNEASSTSNMRSNKSSITKSKLRGPAGNAGPDEDDGDYATLRELPLLPSMVHDAEDDTTSEEGKLLACVHDDNVTYASTSRDLIPPADYEDPSPLLTPEPLDRDETAISANNTNPVNVTVHNHTQLTASQTPRCLRRADSGMPHEELTPRSDSLSTESSTSPPDPPGSNHSETSSGVHSNASSDHHHPSQPESQPHLIPQSVSRRATSVADLVQQKDETQWKSCSLQRNVQPPNPIYGYSGSSVTGSQSIKTISEHPSDPGNIAQRNSQPLPVNTNSIYGYTTSAGVVTTDGGIQTVVVKPPGTNYSPSTSNQGLYGYATANTKVSNSVDGSVQTVVVKPSTTSPHYGFTGANNKPTADPTEHGIPAVILENSAENTVVIRRKNTNPSAIDNQQIPVIKEEPFGRSTNMRMTSFTEHNDLKNIQASSATLPHYPTQPIPPPAQYPHCSTMPLPHSNQTNTAPNLGAGTSCQVYPRQHTTIPTHHNGVRLFPPNQNPYVKRLQNFQNGGVKINTAQESIYGNTATSTKNSGDIYHYNS